MLARGGMAGGGPRPLTEPWDWTRGGNCGRREGGTVAGADGRLGFGLPETGGAGTEVVIVLVEGTVAGFVIWTDDEVFDGAMCVEVTGRDDGVVDGDGDVIDG